MATRNLKRLLLLRLSNLLTESAEWGEIGFLLDCEDLIQKHPRLLRSRYNNDDDYPSCVLDVVNQIEAKSPKLIDQLIEHIGFKEWLRSTHASDFQALYGSEESRYQKTTFDQSTKLRAFISYAHQDALVAGNLKHHLELFGIDAFLAHEDIEPTAEWRETILENLKNCNVFLPILTEAASQSIWVHQESGIAVLREMVIVPLKSTQDPKAFLAKYQAYKFPAQFTPSAALKLARLISTKAGYPEYCLDAAIESLGHAINFAKAGEMAELIEEFGSISFGQSNRILDVAVLNSQVSGSFKAERIIRRLLQPHLPSIPKKSWAKFQEATKTGI
jgi:AbiJ N-terminal domain 5/TIR domain